MQTEGKRPCDRPAIIYSHILFCCVCFSSNLTQRRSNSNKINVYEEFQVKAFAHVERRDSIVVCTPTGSGKHEWVRLLLVLFFFLSLFFWCVCELFV
jgi:hypothetical protein